MGALNKLKSLFRPKIVSLAMPAGIPRQRVSQEDFPPYGNLILSANQYLSMIDPKVPREFLDIIEKFAIINPDYSQALSNIVILGNSGHEIEITAGSEADLRKATDQLNALAAKINTDELVNKMLRQAAINGALSLEWVPAPDLSGIERVAIVPARSIYFRYDKIEDRYLPTQYVSSSDKYVDLNELTYLYYAIETSDNSPYAIPPFVAALGNTIIQLYMMDNLKFVMKKIGMLGLVDAVLKAPPPDVGESNEHYQARLNTFLEDFAKNFAENYRDGIAAHYDTAELKMQSVGADVRGAKDLLQMNEEQIASGLKTDPAMLGRTYSTTETYAGVVYAKMIKQVSSYQRLCKRAIEKGYRLHLLLAGISVNISCTFNPNPTYKPVDDATAEQIRTDTVIAKMDAGFIGPDDAARELGYEKAYSGDFPTDQGPDSSDSELRGRFSFKDGRYKLTGMTPDIRSSLFDFANRHKNMDADRESSLERRRLRWTGKYSGEIFNLDSIALKNILENVKTELVKFLDQPPDVFAEQVYSLASALHPQELKLIGLERTVRRNVRDIYRFYRVRDSLLKGKRVPVNLTLADNRAVDFIGGLDDFHISRYITNEPVRKKMIEFLKEQHLSGKTAKADSFIKEFHAELKGFSKSEVRRIVDTSVTRIRTWGHVRQMAEARMKTAEISEVMDSVTCPTCSAMNGKVYRVGVADAKIRELSALSPDEFQGRVYDNAPQGWKDDPAGFAEDKSAEDMIALDIFTPFHPH